MDNWQLIKFNCQFLFGTVFGFFRGKESVMIPMWFFILVILTICYLLYLTRRTEEDFVMMSRNRWKKFQVWVKGEK